MIAALVSWSLRAPRSALLTVLGLLVVAAWMCLQLGVQSSRHALVAPDHPYQSRLVALEEDFGNPDDLVFVVEAPTLELRHRIVDDLSAALQKDPHTARGTVMGRSDPLHWVTMAVRRHPEELWAAFEGLSPGSAAEDTKAGDEAERPLASTLLRGIPGLLHLAQSQLMRDDLELPEGEEWIERGDELLALLNAVFEGQSPLLLRAQLWQAIQRAAPEGFSGYPQLDAAGYLQTYDKQASLVILGSALQSDDSEEIAALVGAVRAIQAKLLQRYRDERGHAVSIGISGIPVLTVDEQAAIARGLWQSSIVTGLGIIVVLGLAFRSLRRAIVALIPLGVGAVLSMAVLWLLFGQVNAITSAFLAVLLGLGIDISVHFLVRCHQEIDESPGDKPQSILRAMSASGPAVAVGCATTGLAFLMLYGAEFDAYGELGVVTACGLALMFLAAMVVLPALLCFPRLASTHKERPPGGGQRFLAWLEQRLRGSSAIVVVVACALAIAGGSQLTRLSFNARYFDFLPERFESSAVLKRLENDRSATPLMVSVRAKDLEDARKKSEILRASKDVAGVQSPADVLPKPSKEGWQALLRLREHWAQSEAPQKIDAQGLRQESAKWLLSLVDAIDERLYLLEQQQSQETAAVQKALRSWRGTLAKLQKRVDREDFDTRGLLLAQRGFFSIVDELRLLLRSEALERQAWTGRDLPEDLQRRFVSASQKRPGFRLLVAPPANFWEGDVARRFIEAVEAVDPESAGHGMSVIVHSDMIRGDFIRATIYAVLAIIFVLALSFRRVEDVLTVLIPVAIGWGWMLGVLALLGISFNAANIVVLPLVLGIGVDAGVHMVHRAREGQRDELSPDEIMKRVMGRTGVAVSVSALTTMVGFAGLTVAEYGGMKSLGFAMVLGVGLTWGATLVVLPALLRLRYALFARSRSSSS